MSRFALVPILLVVLALVTGCGASAPTRSGYDAYLQASLAREQAQAQKITAFADMAKSCATDDCVKGVAFIAGGAMIGAGGGGGSAIAPPPREISGAEKVAAVVSAFSPLAGTLINGAVQIHQSDNAVKQSDSQYRYLDHVLTSALDGMATTAGNAVPSITVGGNYGDTYGDNFTGRDRTDVAGNLMSGDGNVVGDRNFNSGRQDSTGPFDRTCTGDACQAPASDSGQ